MPDTGLGAAQGMGVHPPAHEVDPAEDDRSGSAESGDWAVEGDRLRLLSKLQVRFSGRYSMRPHERICCSCFVSFGGGDR